MHAYSLALYIHLLSLILAVATASLVTFASLQLRIAETPAEIGRWGSLIHKVVPAFPVSAIGLFATGAYMTQHLWSWSTPWIDSAIAGLVLIVVLGDGIDASRGRQLKQEVIANGLSGRARKLVRDPLGWSAKVTTLTLTLAVVYVMTLKPGAAGASAALVVAVLAGCAIAVPLWKPAPEEGSPVADAAG
jgi:hypothetical protein